MWLWGGGTQPRPPGVKTRSTPRMTGQQFGNGRCMTAGDGERCRPRRDDATGVPAARDEDEAMEETGIRAVLPTVEAEAAAGKDARIPALSAAAALNQAEGLYDPAHERDSCGVGFIVNLKNRK